MRGGCTGARGARVAAWFVLGWAAGLAAEGSKIVRPTDRAALAGSDVEVIAIAPAGTLELDGTAVAASEPFPNVLHATVKAGPGEHTLALVWGGGRTEVRFFVGDKAPEGFRPYVAHPPRAGAACTQCHGLSRRGRFRFVGGCFDCHQEEAFANTHSHPAHVLRECGMCHNAHGSTAEAHLTLPKEAACKQCHN